MPNAQQWVAMSLVVASMFVLTGCPEDLSGILAADKTGTVLEPPATREHPLTHIREQCGEAGPVGDSLRRHPYMQLVTPASAKIMWTSSAAEPETVVVWNADSERREQPAEVEETRYLRGAHQLGASLEGLAPSTIYCYELHDASGATVYGPLGFRTAAASPDQHVDFAVFGDSGNGSADQAAVAAQLETVPLDFMLHVGDVAYNSGELHELETNHFAMYRAIQGAVPLFPAIGDHDNATDDAGPFREVFALPPEPGGERYYSFDWGPVHVLTIDCFGSGPEQVEFVERDLASSTAPWKVVIVDEPAYSSGFHGSAMHIRDTYAPIFARNGVSLVFSGDDHHYERSVPIDGVTYIVTGGGGRSVRPVGTSDFTALAVTVFHFMYLSAERDVLRVRAIDATGREFDGLELRK